MSTSVPSRSPVHAHPAIADIGAAEVTMSVRVVIAPMRDVTPDWKHRLVGFWRPVSGRLTDVIKESIESFCRYGELGADHRVTLVADDDYAILLADVDIASAGAYHALDNVRGPRVQREALTEEQAQARGGL